MESQITDAKKEIGELWEYRRMKEELQGKLKEIKILRYKIKKFEENHK